MRNTNSTKNICTMQTVLTYHMYRSFLGIFESFTAFANPFWLPANTEAKKFRYPHSSAVKVNLYAVSSLYTCSPNEARGKDFLLLLFNVTSDTESIAFVTDGIKDDVATPLAEVIKFCTADRREISIFKEWGRCRPSAVGRMRLTTTVTISVITFIM